MDGVLHHGPELQDSKESSIATDARLSEEDRTTSFNPDRRRNDRPQGKREEQADPRKAEIERALEHRLAKVTRSRCGFIGAGEVASLLIPRRRLVKACVQVIRRAPTEVRADPTRIDNERLRETDDVLRIDGDGESEATLNGIAHPPGDAKKLRGNRNQPRRMPERITDAPRQFSSRNVRAVTNEELCRQRGRGF